MKKIVYTSRFESELEEIYEYIISYTQNENIATSIYNGILEDIIRLEYFPNIGIIESVPNSYLSIRSIVVFKNYRVYYFMEENFVVVFSIWNCKRNPDNLNLNI